MELLSEVTVMHLRKTLFLLAVAAEGGANPLAVEAGNVLTLNLLGAFSLASVGVGAGTKAELVHLADHLLHAVLSLRLALRQESEVAHLSTNEKHSTGILACCHTGTTADALSGIHSLVGLVFGDEDAVGIRHTTRSSADIATSLYNLVESGAVHHEVADDGERLGTPRLNPDFVAIIEMTHVELARRHAVVVAVRTTVDVETTHTANTLAAVVVETDRVSDMVVGQFLVEDVKHLEEGAVGRDVLDLVGLKTTFGLGILLSPDMKC